MKVVLDTNVLISGALIPGSTPAAIVQAWREARIEVLASQSTRAELRTVLDRPRVARRLPKSAAERHNFIGEFVRLTTLVEPDLVIAAIDADPSDNRFLELAVAGGADYIVSGDAHLATLGSYEGIPILTPARFLSVLALE